MSRSPGRDHSYLCHLDPTRFAGWGDSAGAYTVIMLGVTGDQRTNFDDPAFGVTVQAEKLAAV